MSHGIRFLALSGFLAATAPFAAQSSTDPAFQYHLTDAIVGTAIHAPAADAAFATFAGSPPAVSIARLPCTGGTAWRCARCADAPP